MTSNNDDTIPREQVETALRFLEECHGDSLKWERQQEAHAYYQAIDVLEDAMNEELRSPDELSLREDAEKSIKRSREAREEGYAAATLLDQIGADRETYEPGFLDRVFDRIHRMLHQ